MAPPPPLPEEPRALAAEAVRRWGPHPARLWGIRLGADDARETSRWLVASCLLDGRTAEERAEVAFRALAESGWDHPSSLSGADPETLAEVLSGAGIPKPESRARLLLRLSGGLGAKADHRLESLPRNAASLEELGGALAALAPGFGRASVTRFLQPLRGIWAAAAQLPLDPAARTAALHLGLLQTGEDEDGEPAVLGRLLRGSKTELADAEAALARLGRRSCLREKTDRCPLEAACPARRRSEEA